jgi:hypothetical protein
MEAVKVYLMVEYIDGDDFDYWIFDTFKEAVEWLDTYPIHSHNWTLSSGPVGLPESEYTKWSDVEKHYD